MPNMDDQIGSNVARLRGDMSQRELARRMSELGWAWTNITVSTIERGKRSVRLAETMALCQILNVSVEDIVGDPASLQIAELRRDLRSADRAVEAALVDWLSTRSALADLELQLRDTLSAQDRGVVDEYVYQTLDDFLAAKAKAALAIDGVVEYER